MSRNGQKRKVQTELFKYCKRKNNYVFDNDTVKDFCRKIGFANPFEVTKVDSSNLLPDILKKEDYFILHLGKGRHKFVKGINKGYHSFEEVSDKNIINWKYKASLLNEYDTSESNFLSVAFNQRISHHFLYGDENKEAKVYQSRRTKESVSYNVGREKIVTSSVQMEIDQTFERKGVVTVIEGKNEYLDNFAIYQIFVPLVYFHTLKKEKGLAIKDVNCCYVLKKKKKKTDNRSFLRFYLYSFEDPNDMTTIKLVRSAEYRLTKT